MKIISVIIPVYNVEDYLHVCINSVLKQTYQDFEIICIDDASTDSSLDILEYFSKKDSRIRIIKNEINKGLGPSRNIGIEVAKGKYILFLDSDDWYSLDTLETLATEMEENDLEVLMFKNIVYYEETQLFGMEPYYEMELLDNFNHEIFNHWDLDKKLFSIPIGACNKLYLKSFLDENDIRFPNENYIHEDNPFSCKVLICAKRMSYTNKYFYNRRRRPDSIMSYNDDRLFDNIPIVNLILKVFLENKEIYEYYKHEVLTYIFTKVLKAKYEQIEDIYKKEFFEQVQEVFKRFIRNYGLYNDIKENIDRDTLDFFEFDTIIENLLKNS